MRLGCRQTTRKQLSSDKSKVMLLSRKSCKECFSVWLKPYTSKGESCAAKADSLVRLFSSIRTVYCLSLSATYPGTRPNIHFRTANLFGGYRTVYGNKYLISSVQYTWSFSDRMTYSCTWLMAASPLLWDIRSFEYNRRSFTSDRPTSKIKKLNCFKWNVGILCAKPTKSSEDHISVSCNNSNSICLIDLVHEQLSCAVDSFWYISV